MTNVIDIYQKARYVPFSNQTQKTMTKHFGPLFIVLMLFFAFNFTSCQKSNLDNEVYSGTHRIVLLVDTKNIPGTEDVDLDKYCRFADQKADESVKDYLTMVNSGDSIIWYGVSSSDPINDKVLINQINYQGGKNLLGQNSINNVNGIVYGKIIESGDSEDEEKYIVRFRVIKDGVPPRNFNIDPKIRIP